jgi:hypothetical protein
MLGFGISERTVSRFMPRRTPKPGAVQRWMTFLRNHRDAIAAMDFFVVPTLSFRILYVWFVIEHGPRRILHFHVTDHPSATWVVQQLREAFPLDTAPRHLVFDRDAIYSARVVSMVKSLGHEADPHGSTESMAERPRGALDRQRPPRAPRSRRRRQRPPPASPAARLRYLSS